MPNIKVWVHLIWTTKNKEKILLNELKPLLFNHIKESAKQKSIYIDCINGVSDHVHLLVSLKGDQCLSKITQLIKGESSHWVNLNNLSNRKFEWQDEYIAVSVSESVVPRVREYIRNQEEHHRKKSFQEEYQIFLEKYGFAHLVAKAEKV